MNVALGALLALGLSACDQPESCEVFDATLRGLSYNGLSYNGLSYNGLSYNGLSYNGIKLQGTKLQGLRVNGAGLAGTHFEGLELQGTTLVMPEGEALLGADLPAFDERGEELRVTVESVEADPERADLTYYSLTFEGENICGPGGRGLFVAGSWDDEGTHHPSSQGELVATFSCTTGVVAKCVEWGYTPYEQGADMHQACVRMARADYCGDGVSYTKTGTLVDVFDFSGVMAPEQDPGELRFEAGWGAEGAICVNEPRYQMIGSAGEELAPPCWQQLPRCETAAQAQTMGALVANRSEPQVRRICTDAD